MNRKVKDSRSKKNVIAYNDENMGKLIQNQNDLIKEELQSKLNLDLTSLRSVIDLPAELKMRAMAAVEAVRIRVKGANSANHRMGVVSPGGSNGGGVPGKEGGGLVVVGTKPYGFVSPVPSNRSVPSGGGVVGSVPSAAMTDAAAGAIAAALPLGSNTGKAQSDHSVPASATVAAALPFNNVGGRLEQTDVEIVQKPPKLAMLAAPLPSSTHAHVSTSTTSTVPSSTIPTPTPVPAPSRQNATLSHSHPPPPVASSMPSAVVAASAPSIAAASPRPAATAAADPRAGGVAPVMTGVVAPAASGGGGGGGGVANSTAAAPLPGATPSQPPPAITTAASPSGVPAVMPTPVLPANNSNTIAAAAQVRLSSCMLCVSFYRVSWCVGELVRDLGLTKTAWTC